MTGIILNKRFKVKNRNTQESVCPAPLILVGAPRSGTKMLREMLKLHPSIDGPLYELERVWCYGNKDKIGKRLEPSNLTPDIKKYIRNHFYKMSRCNNGKRIIDKNVSNILRVEYVNAIFPDSPIIHIVRDGRDAACSARARWRSPADFKYIFKYKAFPIKEVPYFVVRQLKFYLDKVLNRRNHVKWWGPRFEDSEELFEKYSLIELCGIQWKRCVEAVLKSSSELKLERFIQVKYEDVISDPVKEFNKIFHFLALSSNEQLDNKIKQYTKPGSIGRWKKELSQDEIEPLMGQIKKSLELLGYINENGSKSIYHEQ